MYYKVPPERGALFYAGGGAPTGRGNTGRAVLGGMRKSELWPVVGNLLLDSVTENSRGPGPWGLMQAPPEWQLLQADETARCVTPEIA